MQTGFGRTGDHYWGFENLGVTPDFVTMAKGIGNGVPLAAVTTRREIAQALDAAASTSTPSAETRSPWRPGLAVLDVIDEETAPGKRPVVGARLKAGLEELMRRHPLIGDVRGMGLMLGVELVRDRATKEPARAETADVLERLPGGAACWSARAALTATSCASSRRMCITADDVDFAVAALDYALGRTVTA